MRKSPMSTPGGSGGQRNCEWNSRGRRHGYNGIGYDQFQRGANVCKESLSSGPIQTSSQKISDDFIPLGYSSPMNQHQHQHQQQQQQGNGGNWRGSGGWQRSRGATGNGGYNFHRNNSYHNSPKSSFNDSNSPNYFQKQNFFHRRPRQKDSHRQVDISSYVNVRSMLEDPWADLMRQYECNSRSSEYKSDLSNRNIGVKESLSRNNLTKDDVLESDNANDDNVSKDGLEEADINEKRS